MQQFEITPQELEFLKQMRKQEEISEEEELVDQSFSVSRDGVGLVGYSVEEITTLAPVMVTLLKSISKVDHKKKKQEREPAIGFITVDEEEEEDDEDDWEE